MCNCQQATPCTGGGIRFNANWALIIVLFILLVILCTGAFSCKKPSCGCECEQEETFCDCGC